MRFHGGAGGSLDRFRITLALVAPFGQGPAGGQVAVDRIVRRGLVRDDVRLDAAPNEFGEDVGGVAEEANRLGLTGRGPALDLGQGFIQRVGALVEIFRAQAEVDAGWIALDGEATGARENGRERLCAAHPAEAAGQDPFAAQVAVVVLATGFGERFIGALDDALGANVDPRTGCHLAIHHETLAIELIEMVPIGPVRYEVGVGNQNARGIGVGAEHADGFSRLHEQGVVVIQRSEFGDDAVKVVPGARRAPDAAVDNQFVRAFGDVGVQVVHEHAHRRFGQPALGRDVGSGRREDVACVVTWIGHRAASGG